MKTLGIDLGSNSLGWAILNETEIADQGVIIFDEGINRVKGVDSLESLAAKRRKYRMARRLKFRRRLRKYHVMKILIENGMCPLTEDELKQLKNTGNFPANPDFIEWLKSTPSSLPEHVNPYYARAMAAEKKIDKMLLGRALYHLAQRRGFKSSRKDAAESEDSENQNAKELGQVKKEIAELTEELQKQNCTLGQYFYRLNMESKKIRKRHIGRVEHYQKEFEKIAEVQEFTPELKTQLFNALFSQRPLRSQKHLVGKCQLEKNRNRCLIGHPLFEMFRMNSFINTIKVDEGDGFRFLVKEERDKVIPLFFRKDKYFDFSKIIKVLYPQYNPKKNKNDFPIHFNYRADKDISSCPVTHQLNLLLDENCFEWKLEKNSEKKVIYDYQTVFDALIFYDDDSMLKDFGCRVLGFDEKKAEQLTKIRIPEGYANYSLHAIRKINYFLEKGLELSKAIFLAKIPDILGKDIFEKNQEKIIDDIQQIIADYRTDLKNQEKIVRTIPLNIRLRGYLEDEWKLLPSQIDMLYWNTGTYSQVNSCGMNNVLLGKVELGMIKNPMAQRSLTVLRHLVNDLRKSGKIDEFTKINIELARSVNDRNHRMAWETWQLQKAAERKSAADELRPLLGGKEPNDDLIDKFILRKEQNNKCLYTGRIIELSDLISENSSFDIEHTVPRSRSGDNSMANKTLSDMNFNRNVKKGCLPAECCNYEDEIKIRLAPWIEKRNQLKELFFSQMKAAKHADPSVPERKATLRQKALVTEFEYRYWDKKVRYFETDAEHIGEDFMNRQLVDTGVMTRHAVEFLRSVYPQTYPVNGTAVAWARKCWKIQALHEKKERIDHTHHVLDAIVIAALDRKRFQEICTLFRDDWDSVYEYNKNNNLLAKTAPFKNFADCARIAADKVLVKRDVRHNEFKQTWKNALHLSHPHKLEDGTLLRKVFAGGDTVRGQLHGETFYGLITNPADQKQKFVVRKFINDNGTFKTDKDFDKIVDPGVRAAVRSQVKKYTDNGIAFKNAINSPLWMKMPDENGEHGIPVIKVRIFADSVTEPHRLRAQKTPSEKEYKNFYYVNSSSGANFRVALFQKQKKSKGKIVDYWELEVQNILTYAKQLKNPDYIPPENQENSGFLGYIYQGCAALKYEHSPDELKTLSKEDLQKRLYTLVKFEKSGRMTLRYHREARDPKMLSDYLVSTGKSGTGESSFQFDSQQELLYVSPSKLQEHLLFEGIHFEISLDGSLRFL